MRCLILAALVLAVTATPVHASDVILVAGDSIPKGVVPYLQALLPRDTVIDAAVKGDTSRSTARIAEAIDQTRPTILVLEFGTNDAVLDDLTPAQSLRNLRRMASYARAIGATVYVLTPPPVVCKFPEVCGPETDAGTQDAVANEHTRALATLLLATRLPPRMTVLDLRDRWQSVPNGWWAHCDILGTHPSTTGYPIMAGWIADAIDAGRR